MNVTRITRALSSLLRKSTNTGLNSLVISLCHFEFLNGVQGWRSNESTRLPPMSVARVRFPAGSGVICRLRLLVLHSALFREVFSGYSGFPSPKNPAFDLICVNC